MIPLVADLAELAPVSDPGTDDVDGGLALLTLHRAWPRDEGHLLLELRDAAGRVVAGQWHGERARAQAVAGATPGAVLVAAPTAGAVVLQPDGGDRRLPALRALATEAGATLVGHRAERRGVVCRAAGTFAKVVRPNRVAGLLAADAAVRATRAVPVPELVHVDHGAGTVEWAALPGCSLRHLVLDPQVPMSALVAAGTALGTVLAALHRAPLPVTVDRRTAADEVASAAGWAAQARAWWRTSPGVADELRRAAAALAGPPSPPVLLHRDLHEQQVMVDGGRVALLDLDTTAAGEAAIDLANLLVHLELLVALGAGPARAAAVAAAVTDAYRPAPGVAARVPGYAAATRARLACLHAFRPPTAAAAARLVEARPGPAADGWGIVAGAPG